VNEEIPRDPAGVLEWAGQDVERLHVAWQAEVDKPPARQRPELLHQLRERLGWPAPDTPPATVLAWCQRPGFTPARCLATEQARPERWQRPELIAQLAEIVARQGQNASALAPARPDFKGLFR
jgi:hypothetical protein